MLEKTLESPLNCKEIQVVNPKGNQSWIFAGRTDAEAPILWPPDAKNWLIIKDPDAGKDWRQEEKGTTEDKMVDGHPWLSGHDLEQAPEVGNGQGGLPCCKPWGHKESDTTEQLTWTEIMKTTRLLCPWDSPGKDTGVGSHSLLQGVFSTQGSNLGLSHCKQIL